MSDPTYKNEVDEVYSLILDYEDNDCLKFDEAIAPRLRELFHSVYQRGWKDAALLSKDKSR